MFVLFLIGVIAALGSAGLFMLRRKGDAQGGADAPGADKRMARALALRVGLSVSLFALILLAWAMGWIHPTGIPVQ